MKFQFVSDLHLEIADNSRYLKEYLPVTGEVLLIAGDSIYLGQEHLLKHPFWKWAADNYERVIAVPGNHEYYAFYDLASVPKSHRWELASNVHICSNTVEHIGDVDIVASTLWAHIDLKDAYLTELYVSDFYRIRYGENNLTAALFNKEHLSCVDFIKKSVRESCAATKIVLTHHVPSPLVTAEEFKNSSINGAFVADLTEYIAQSDINYWIYGHSHRNVCKQIGNTQVLSNQLGYVSRQEFLHGFNPSAHISV